MAGGAAGWCAVYSRPALPPLRAAAVASWHRPRPWQWPVRSMPAPTSRPVASLPCALTSNEGSSEALLATAADMQGAIFSEAVSLLPSDVKHAAQTFRGEVGSIEDLRTALQRSAGEADSAADATAQDAEDDGAEAWEAGERELEEQLARFSDLSKGFLELHREVRREPRGSACVRRCCVCLSPVRA